MSINDKSMYEGAKGQDVMDGLRNYSESSNPVTDDQAQAKQKYDAWAASGQRGMGDGEPGVVEAAPGIIDGARIEPLAPSKIGDTDDFAAGATSATGRVSGQASSVVDTVLGAAKQAYGSATGDKSLEAEGKKQYEGSA